MLTSYLKKQNTVEPDYRAVIACSESLSRDVVEELENVIGGIAGDANGDGKVSIDIQALKLVDVSGNIDLANPGENSDDAFNRMAMYLANGEYNLFLLSDEPSGGFKGAATVYGQADFFAELPEELADPILDAIDFYGCVLDSGNTAAENQAMDILRQLKTAHVALW